MASSEESIKNFELNTNFNQLTLFYDMTFNLGDFLLSVLFEDEPVIPIMYLPYHRKNKEVHEQYFSWFTKLCPSATIKDLITDGEKAITYVIKSQLPDIKHFIFWNQIQQDVKYWVYKQQV